MWLLNWLTRGKPAAAVPPPPTPPCVDDDDDDDADPEFHHPVLGDMYMDTGSSWLAEQVTVSFAGEPVEVNLAGDEDGPTPDAIDGFEFLHAHPEQLRQTVQTQLFESYLDYFDGEDDELEIETPEAIWGSETMIGITIADRHNYDIIYIFDWQFDGDEQEIIVSVEDGVAESRPLEG